MNNHELTDLLHSEAADTFQKLSHEVIRSETFGFARNGKLLVGINQIVDRSDDGNLRAGYSRTIASGLVPAGQELRKGVVWQLGCQVLTVCRIGGAPRRYQQSA